MVSSQLATKVAVWQLHQFSKSGVDGSCGPPCGSNVAQMSSSSSSLGTAPPLLVSNYNDLMELANIMMGGRTDEKLNDTSVTPAKAVAYTNSWWFCPLILLFWSALYEFMSFVSMTVVADFYLTVASNDSGKFLYTLRKACVVIAILSVCKSFLTFYVDKCALRWRENLVDYLHGRYFSCLDRSHLTDSGPMSEMIACNPEQRISQDIDRLTIETAKNFDKLLITPALILFYSYYLWCLFGWQAPSFCYVYFVVGAIVSGHLVRRMVDPIIRQEKLEGEFRLNHSNMCKNLQQINLLRGVTREKSKAVETFSILLSNWMRLITLRLHANLFINMHSYSGSIGTTSILIYIVCILDISYPNELSNFTSFYNHSFSSQLRCCRVFGVILFRSQRRS